MMPSEYPALPAISSIAWLVWNPLDRALGHGLEGLGWIIVDALLATLFLLGLETVVFGMIPLVFLKGKKCGGGGGEPGRRYLFPSYLFFAISSSSRGRLRT